MKYIVLFLIVIVISNIGLLFLETYPTQTIIGYIIFLIIIFIITFIFLKKDLVDK